MEGFLQGCVPISAVIALLQSCSVLNVSPTRRPYAYARKGRSRRRHFLYVVFPSSLPSFTSLLLKRRSLFHARCLNPVVEKQAADRLASADAVYDASKKFLFAEEQHHDSHDDATEED
jgi:hypothetical protein